MDNHSINHDLDIEQWRKLNSICYESVSTEKSLTTFKFPFFYLFDYKLNYESYILYIYYKIDFHYLSFIRKKNQLGRNLNYL